MKFTAVIDDSKSVEAVKNAMAIASKYSTSTKFTILLTSSGWSFICAVPVQSGHYIELKLGEKEVFSKFNFEGHSEKMDFIVFSISRIHFAQLFQQNSHVIKFKLCTRHKSPHLSVDLKTIGISSLIPVNFLFEFGEDYIAPTIKEDCLAICATPLPTVIKTLSALSQLKIDEIYLSMYQAGKIKFSADSDHSTYKLILSDLEILDESTLQEDIRSARFDLRMLQQFFTSLPQDEEKFFMRMSADGLLQILFKYKYVTTSLVTRCHREIEED
uniref:Checkpoint protein n=1 Tax=Panagrolaimus sp. JU765 TaxID=591449 RepID=A0AC34Q5I6_9BILA